MVAHSTQRFPFRVVDLTHPIEPSMPTWPGDPATCAEAVAQHDREGWQLSAWTLGEHTGTHIGAPSHFIPGGATIDRVSTRDLVLPVAMVEADPRNPVLTVDHLRAHEVAWGELIPPGAAVLLRTGWERRWPDPERVFERQGNGFAWPGFGVEAVEWLTVKRKVRAIGSDAPGIDSGSDDALAAGRTCARAGALHLENLANLEGIPALGAWVVLAGLPFVGGSGSPARVLALLP